MKVIFYVSNDYQETIDKTLEQASSEFDMYFLNRENFIFPIIRIAKEHFNNIYNYCKIDNSYYFIVNVSAYNNDMLVLSLQKDLLKTYENEILANAYVEINASENIFNSHKIELPCEDDFSILSSSEIENPFNTTTDILTCVYGQIAQ